MCLLHKWGKWQGYTLKIPARQITKKWMLSAAIEQRQRAICQKCGKVKDGLIAMQVLA
jgi:hypothetical protein